MKGRYQISAGVFTGYWIFSVVIFIICGSAASAATETDAVAEEIISLDVDGQPLGEVLDKISKATGYEFIIDESWKDFAVSASFKNLPLHRGLKKILQSLNNAIVYRSDRKIKIIIYEDIQQAEKPPAPARKESPPPKKGSKSPVRSPSRTQTTESETSQNQEDTQTEEQTSNESGDESADSESTDEQSSESEDTETKSSGEQSDQDVSSEQNDQSSGDESAETEQSESEESEDTSENSENTESSSQSQ